MTPQELKNSILQLAIQGKLVEQRPEEGTAEELYRQIQAEKQKLIKEGKIKKEKVLPDIVEEEKPFDIPESWKWVRIGNAFSTIMGQSPNGESVSEGIDGIEFHQGKIFFTSRIIEHSPQKTTMPTKIAPANSLLICVRAPVGKVNITDRELCIGRGLSAIIPYCEMTEVFLLYWFQTYENVFVKQSTGTTFKAISADIINNQLIPLPPLAEQKRIVTKIEELLPLIDRYEKAWSRLEEFNKRFPDDMQKSILQMAIQGKLVEQRPEEGTAEELYQQIQAEKQKLIKEGKIKKEKVLPDIVEEEKPFDIPESWKWVRIGNAFSTIMGQSPNGESVSEGIDGIEFHQGKIFFTSRIIEHSPQKTTMPTKIAPANSLLICVRAPVGKVNITDRELCIGRGLSAIIPYCEMTEVFLLYWFQTYENVFVKQSTGTTFKAISADIINNQLIPLPPLAEQKRIVAKIEELLPLCDRLKRTCN